MLLLASCAAEVPPPPQAPERTLWLRAVGDVMLARGIERQWRGEVGLGGLFAHLAPLLRAPDMTFANLECTLAYSGRQMHRGIPLRAHPNALFALTDAGFDVVSLANNHSDDFGPEALAETRARVESAGVRVAGAPGPKGERPLPVVLTRRGLRVAFLAYTVFHTTRFFVDDSAEALQLLAQEVAAARAKADLLVVSYHWGEEYKETPDAQARAIAHVLIDAGADLVLGHHPHQLQGVEIYKGKAIAYSLGNFLFDQPWPHTRDSALLDWRVSESGEQELWLYPVLIERKPYAPILATGEDGARITATLERLSRALGAHAVVVDGRVSVAPALDRAAAAR